MSVCVFAGDNGMKTCKCVCVRRGQRNENMQVCVCVQGTKE